MIESIEAIVGRHQAEAASRDGRDEAMDASKFRKVLGAFSKGKSGHDSAQGSLEDLMSAMVVEPLPLARVSKEPRRSHNQESHSQEVEAPSEDPPVEKSEHRQDEDTQYEACTSNQTCVEVKRFEPEKALTAEKPADGVPEGDVVHEVPGCDLQPAMLSDAGPDVTAPVESPIGATPDAGPDGAEGFTMIETNLISGPISVNSENSDDSVINGNGDLVEQLQAYVQSENTTEESLEFSGKEIIRDTSLKDAQTKSEAFTTEQLVPLQQIENAAVSQEPIASIKTLDPKTIDESVSMEELSPAKVTPTATSNDLPVVEGLLQLRALIERVSKEARGIGNTVSGAQAELVHSIEQAQDSGLNGLSAIKENSVSKPVTNVFGEKSNQGIKAPKEKATGIPERMLPKMMEKLEQVAREVERSKDGRSISLRLDPPQLGKVRVDMTIKDGSIHTRLTAESELVAHFLRERGDELQALIRKVLPHLDQATVSFGESSADNYFGKQMNFGGDSFKGFADNGGRERGDGRSDSGSGDDGKMKSDRIRRNLSGSGEHWVA